MNSLIFVGICIISLLQSFAIGNDLKSLNALDETQHEFAMGGDKNSHDIYNVEKSRDKRTKYMLQWQNSPSESDDLVPSASTWPRIPGVYQRIPEEMISMESSPSIDYNDMDQSFSNIVESDMSAISSDEPIEIKDISHYCQYPFGQFPLPNSCSKFVNCWFGIAFVQECPNDQFFVTSETFATHYTYGYCASNINVNCKEQPLLPSEINCQNAQNGFYRHPDNCSVFFKCDNGLPVEMSCPEGLYFNTNHMGCDYMYNVDCPNDNEGESESSTEESENLTEKNCESEITTENNSESGNTKMETTTMVEDERVQLQKNLKIGILRTDVPCNHTSVRVLSENCSQVVICSSSGFSQVINCPTGTGFDIKIKRCIAESIAKCQ